MKQIFKSWFSKWTIKTKSIILENGEAMKNIEVPIVRIERDAYFGIPTFCSIPFLIEYY